MKTSKWLTLTLAITLAAGGIFALHAASAKAAATNRPTHGHLLKRAKEQLGLSDEQINQIKSVLKADKDSLTELLTRMHATRSGLREAIRANDANESTVRAASAKVAAVEADFAVERLKLFGKISPILTAEQRAKLQEMQAQLDEFMDGIINRMDNKLAE